LLISLTYSINPFLQEKEGDGSDLCIFEKLFEVFFVISLFTSSSSLHSKTSFKRAESVLIDLFFKSK